MLLDQTRELFDYIVYVHGNVLAIQLLFKALDLKEEQVPNTVAGSGNCVCFVELSLCLKIFCLSVGKS